MRTTYIPKPDVARKEPGPWRKILREEGPEALAARASFSFVARDRYHLEGALTNPYWQLGVRTSDIARVARETQDALGKSPFV